LERIPAFDSAIDLGCGVGTWLSVLQEKGVKEIRGIDGSWIDQNLLVIPRTCFEQADLGKPIKISKKYDLAISLEVAEHLPSNRAEGFIFLLTELSDFVLFSAAIPSQEGTNHINKQWQHYWVNLFDGLDYVAHDFIRPRIWNDSQIPFYYRQNILFFSRRQKSADVQLDSIAPDASLLPLDVVHPDLYIHAYIGVRASFALLRKSLRKYINRKLGKVS
jgi:hypothetical protein